MVLIMKHKLFSLITVSSFLLSLILAGFTPAQAGLTNSNHYYLLTGRVFLDDKLYNSDLKNWRSVSITVGNSLNYGAQSEPDGSYSIRLSGDVKIVSFCRSTSGDMPYNTNSQHCSYLDTSLVTLKLDNSPLTYSYDFNFKTSTGKMMTGNITSPEKKVNGHFSTTYVKVYSDEGILERMNVFGNKYQISIPSSATRISFCKVAMDCIVENPNSSFWLPINNEIFYNVNFKKIADVTLSGIVRDSNGKIFKGKYTLFERDAELNTYHSEFKDSFSGSYSIPFSSRAIELTFCTAERCTDFSLKGKYPVGKANKNVVMNLNLKPDFLFEATVMSGLLYSNQSAESGNNIGLGNVEPGAYVKILDKITGKYTKYYANSDGVYSALFSSNYAGLTQCNAIDECVDNSRLGYLDGSALSIANNNGFDMNWKVPSLPGEIYLKKNIAQSLNYQVKGKVFYSADGFQVRPSVLPLGSTVKSLDSAGKVINSVSTNSLGEFVLPLTENVASLEACNSFGFCYPQYPDLLVEQTFTVPSNYVGQKVNDLPKVKHVTSGTLTGTFKPFLTAKFNEAKWGSTVTTIYSYNKSGKVITTKVLPVNGKKSLKDFEFSLPIDLNVYKIRACIKLGKENHCSSNEINPVESKVFLISPYPYPYQVFEVK